MAKGIGKGMPRAGGLTRKKRCSGRCWFAYYGWVGSSSPTCRRCGRPNPGYRKEDDPFV